MKKFKLTMTFLISAALIFSLAACSAKSKETSLSSEISSNVSNTEKDKTNTNGVNNSFDEISGYSWTGNDGSLIVLNDDNTFIWYRSADVTNDYYYEGTYAVYNGDNAVKYISEDLAEYNVTAKEQEDLFAGSVNEYTKDNYYCLVLTNEKMIVEGENSIEEAFITPYFGFYMEDSKYLDIANMNTANYHGYTRMD